MSTPSQSLRLRPEVEHMPPSGIREFFDLTLGMEGVVTLGVGEPDFATPWKICDAVVDSLRRGQTSYTSNYGLMELREAIAEDLGMRWGVDYDPATELIVTMGVSEAMDVAMRALLSPGDEVVVPEPCYVSYKACVSMAGGNPVVVPCTVEHDFRPQVEDLEAAITPRTRGLIIGYPNNPTGTVMSREDLLQIARLAEEHDLFVVSDEIYAHLTYDGEHTCFASLPGMRERTILMNGFSKAYAMTGWRIGFTAAPGQLIEGMVRIHAYTALSAPISGQIGAIEALQHCEREMHEMVRDYDQRRRVFIKGLNDIGLPCFEARGAFYAFPSIAHTGLTSKQFSKALLYDEKVAAVPGTAFGDCGEGYLRCTYAQSMDNLKEALVRMERFLAKLKAGKVQVE
ncbi:aminotransferase class I/II-fold pyridoxal phosphate-dependent enzyme [bacterium]|nr:aminotransferase class I/II-fold pyridoxal phosphate-dependent enzyme [bacterium]